MKKMLLLINETGVPYHVMDFAVQLVKHEHYKIYGIFIGSLKPDDDSYPFPNDINLTDTDFTSATYTEEAEQLQQAQINVFENICKTEGLDFDVQIVRKSIIDTLIDETAFADMVLCDIINARLEFFHEQFYFFGTLSGFIDSSIGFII